MNGVLAEVRRLVAWAQARYRKAFEAARTIAEMRAAREDYERAVCQAVHGLRLSVAEIEAAGRAQAEGAV